MSEIKTRTYVDEDWKARVQREKEEARLKAAGAAPTTATPPPEPGAAPAQAAASAPQDKANPFFEGLLNMLATQAMYCLGLLGAQGQAQVVVNLEQAKEVIDTIAMLRDKTQGNLLPDEMAVLAETLAELQRLFAARVQQAQAQAMQQAGIDPQNLRGAPPQ